MTLSQKSVSSKALISSSSLQKRAVGNGIRSEDDFASEKLGASVQLAKHAEWLLDTLEMGRPPSNLVETTNAYRRNCEQVRREKCQRGSEVGGGRAL